MTRKFLNQFLNYMVPSGLILCAIFIILRLFHVIKWSWWWVCAPGCFPLAVVLAAAVWVYFKADDYLTK